MTSSIPGPLAPLGGTLVSRVLPPDAARDFLARAPSLASITLDERSRADLELLATGAFSPLDGFNRRAEYEGIVREMRLPGGTPFSIPIVLSVSPAEGKALKTGQEVALVVDEGGVREVVGSIVVDEIFPIDRELEADNVYRTREDKHPGVAWLYQRTGDLAVGGRVSLAKRSIERKFPAHHRDPIETRKIFDERGWRRVVGFQTRNPVHRAHEYLIKAALEGVDGLLLHPLVGETKSDDVPAAVRMRCYEVLLEKYFPPDRALLSVLPFAMRYAGPREAVLHAILRQNYGCTHFIVGRDHAGVGNYYGTYDAHRIFDAFKPGELGITVMFFEHTFYSKKFGEFGSTKTLPGGPEDRLTLSGTAVREMLSKGELPPPEFSRPEIAQILIEAYRGAAKLKKATMDLSQAKNENVPLAGTDRGAIVWFTGLSGAGKSTIAEALAPVLRSLGKRVEILDGDVVRLHLSKGLGFSKEDRDTNIHRIGFVAHLLQRNGTIVLTAAISPYRSTRDWVRELSKDFVEVFVDTPLEVCEGRDVKGLYKKARAGEIKQFTGISDPYEAPLSPELALRGLSVDESVAEIVKKLRALDYVKGGA